MAIIHWRDEGMALKPGINLYTLRSKSSFGFIADLDRHYFYLRYSKKLHCWLWRYEKREPRAWRVLKENCGDES